MNIWIFTTRNDLLSASTVTMQQVWPSPDESDQCGYELSVPLNLYQLIVCNVLIKKQNMLWQRAKHLFGRPWLYF